MILDYSGARQEVEDFILHYLHQKMEDVHGQNVIHIPLCDKGIFQGYEMTWYSSYEANEDYGFLIGTPDGTYKGFYVTVDESKTRFYYEVEKAIQSMFSYMGEEETQKIYLRFLEEFTVTAILQ